MSRAIDLRLKRLEASRKPGDITIWCAEDSDVPETVEQMIAYGEILEADRSRCVHWTVARIMGGHERALAVL
ncbi:hypothetical protein [Tardiphaga sp. vice278]|uniref:hypothetical protein n=1 Tax=Tardiphaga sp. vice278 TaxID=2592815 RepID=UPI0011643591|nr:hypothetical protein [Tardiphaga sp. vice278]QDM15173.1 hypothetical protein FNL53_03745 [Tardiphaga sp. vice278]